ncbi:MAG: hypothetical protein A2928_00910 [Candidatus Taylorbacteria bacterium RIFCSPLOWO2_01_FULL_45_15b]|uniref:histidine kinase n=1 Tax=Candidatus Taylorbacteria bacterium RIFCSPLOWO2_01_FULL_45_15b TaxID=1802319 RepID=A0A1G2N7R5_9BACT|nr:MAG: hypothetical protein A2928_00910 [Candidatus Taylorbacteria bacterium RIFCSPLOWO2_01_FULL_45_15b]
MEKTTPERPRNTVPESVKLRHSVLMQFFLSLLLMAIVAAFATFVITARTYESAIEGALASEDLQNLHRALVANISVILIIVIVPSVILGFVLADRVLKPIRDIISSIKRLREGYTDIYVAEKRKDELGMLSNFFNLLLDKVKEIEERNKMISSLKSQFITVVAHQLRTPLSGIRWVHQMMLKGELGPISGDQRKYIERSSASTGQVLEVVSDLLNVSKIEEGNFGYEFKEMNIADLFGSLSAQFRLRIEKQQNIEVPVAFSNIFLGQPIVRGDPSRLTIVLTNLIENAIRYSRPGGVVNVTLRGENGSVVIDVTDNGIGIPASEQERIFNKFYRATNALHYQSDGSGLGLYINRSIMEKHNGKIWFTSKEGMGTTFFISLPLVMKEDKTDSRVEDFLGSM